MFTHGTKPSNFHFIQNIERQQEKFIFLPSQKWTERKNLAWLQQIHKKSFFLFQSISLLLTFSIRHHHEFFIPVLFLREREKKPSREQKYMKLFLLLVLSSSQTFDKNVATNNLEGEEGGMIKGILKWQQLERRQKSCFYKTVLWNLQHPNFFLYWYMHGGGLKLFYASCNKFYSSTIISFAS